MCSKIVDYELITLPNGRTKLTENVSYEFCDDLWGEIKSFLLLPHTLATGLAKYCPPPILKNEGYWVCAEAEANFGIRGSKTLAKQLRSNSHWAFDREGKCRIKGLNVDLYYRFLRDAKKKQTTREKSRREEFIRDYKPYHSATGGYFLFQGFWFDSNSFARIQAQDGRSRQKIIDDLNKERFGLDLVSGIRCYHHNKRQRRRVELLDQLKDAVGDLFLAITEELEKL